ncbi:MAG: DegT/DnrJ/EryC1/StrS family aminotransferase [Oligoflexia bacterium]|nr:DegT/DnrJ/EryC1/StrS family aminotransferase [Oligoflexia bacterium]
MIGVGTFRTSQKAKDYVNDVLDSERLSYGPYTQKFERVFAGAHDCRFSIMTASGTCALLIALAALKNKYKWQDGDEVIVPAVTFIATSNVVLQLNLKPVFVDVEPTYYEIDPSKIEAAITSKTRAIIPVHLFGCPCDMDPILAIAKKHNLKIVEDSCETMFTKYKGKSVGSFGDIGCFSTYVAHILITGVGGLCTTNDPDLAINLRSLMNHGRDSIYLSIDDDKNKTKEEMQLIVQRRFKFVQMGYSFRVTEMEGALGLAQFEEHESMMKKRWENGLFFMDKLKHLSENIQLPTVRPDSNHAFMMFPIVLKKEKKDSFVQYLEENGIETREMLPLINQPYYQEIFQIDESTFPVAKWVNESGFYIASHQDLTDDEKDHIVQTFTNYFANKKVEKEKSCLVLLSKGDKRAAIDLFDLIPTASFDQKIFIEASNDQEAPTFYKKNGFEIIQGDYGKGDAIQKALETTNCENIVVLGTDGSNDPKDIDRILIKLRQGNELVIASRFLPDGGRRTNRPLSYRSIGNRFFTFLLGVMTGRNITDCNNLFRGFKRQTYKKIHPKVYGDSALFEMTLLALKADLDVVEVPTIEKPSRAMGTKRNRLLSAFSFTWILFTEAFIPKKS